MAETLSLASDATWALIGLTVSLSLILDLLSGDH